MYKRGLVILVAAFLTLSAACTSWRVHGLSPQQIVTAEQPSSIRVIRSDSTQVVLSQPTVSGDSLTGLTDGKRLSIPVPDIVGLAVPVDDGGKMLALGLVTGAVLTLGALLLIASGNAGN
jgi:hypothetical protein